MNNGTILWVSIYHYKRAVEKWPTKDVRINTYLPQHPFYVEVTRPGYTTQKRGRYKRLRVREAV